MNQNLEFKLQAWLDGELSGSEAQAIEREVAADADVARLAAELRTVKSAMAGNETARVVPETREFYWSKIQRQIERESAQPAPARRMAVWRHWLSPLAGLAGLACILILAIKPGTPATFDEISSTGEGMEAVTFHDQSAGMTVVWLADSEREQPQIQSPAPKTEEGGSGVEVE
jgi:anti-sigma-K factor RskA